MGAGRADRQRPQFGAGLGPHLAPTSSLHNSPFPARVGWSRAWARGGGPGERCWGGTLRTRVQLLQPSGPGEPRR